MSGKDGKKQESFAKLKSFAEASGFELQETEWLGGDKDHSFLHKESGTQREWKPYFLNRRGFPKDIRADLDCFNDLKQFAEDNGFELQEIKWLGSDKKHSFTHKESGKPYKGPPHDIYRHGFPKSLRTNLERFNDLKQLAEANGFELQETKWLGNNKVHSFLHKESGKQCEWTPKQIIRHGYPKDLRTNLERFNDLNQLAEANGFELQETKWLGVKKDHNFLHKETRETYTWTANQVLNQGFPLVKGQRYLTQEVCRQVFVHIFGGEFEANRDRLTDVDYEVSTNLGLLNKLQGERFELDGYEEFSTVPKTLRNVEHFIQNDNNVSDVAFDIHVAFEFQGHPNHQMKLETLKRDKLKVACCEYEGILFVPIDPPKDKKEYQNFWNNIRNSDYMYAYVCKAIHETLNEREDKELVYFPPGFKIDLSNWNPDRERFQNLRSFAEDNGFELLETEWLGDRKEHRFLHKESGRQCKWRPTNVLHNGFPEDLRTNTDHFNKLKQFAEDNGFELLETEWLGVKNEHRFLHKESGMPYNNGVPSRIFHQGFPKDLRTETDRFNELKKFAEDNGFELLETEWLGSMKEHRFLHKESGMPYNNGVPSRIFHQGFPKDLRSKTDRFNELKQLAEDNGFELKETEWLGVKKRHRFFHKKSGKEYEGKPGDILHQGFPKDLRSKTDRFNELKKLAEDNDFELQETEWLGVMKKHRFLHKESGMPYDGKPNKIIYQGFPKCFAKLENHTLPDQSLQAEITAVKASLQAKLSAVKVRQAELAAINHPYPGNSSVVDDHEEKVVRERMVG